MDGTGTHGKKRLKVSTRDLVGAPAIAEALRHWLGGVAAWQLGKAACGMYVLVVVAVSRTAEQPHS